jgi:flagellar biosynthesis protein
MRVPVAKTTMPPDTPSAAGSENPVRPRPSAVALSHSSGSGAPVVVAKGYGDVAEALVQRARDSGLYVHASPELVNLLMRVDLDERIPPALYTAVAEILNWLHNLERASSEHDSHLHDSEIPRA